MSRFILRVTFVLAMVALVGLPHASLAAEEPLDAAPGPELKEISSDADPAYRELYESLLPSRGEERAGARLTDPSVPFQAGTCEMDACNIPASVCCTDPDHPRCLGDLVIPATTQGFPTIAEINSDTGDITIAPFTDGVPFVVFTLDRNDTGVLDGVFHFNSIVLEAGAILNLVGTVPVALLACDDVVLDGDVHLDSRPGTNGGGGPGGTGPSGELNGPPESGGDAFQAEGDGGSAGYIEGESGSGPRPGVGARFGPAGGGGGGNRCPGGDGGTSPPPVSENPGQPLSGGSGGEVFACEDMTINLFGAPSDPKRYLPSGSGGGGGGGDGALYGDDGGDEGGAGGAGGGSFSICTEAAIIVNGLITANGAEGGDTFGAVAGAGGGGSGGSVLLIADSISGSGTVESLGGPGGFGSAMGGTGGCGHILFQANDLAAPPTTNPEYIEVLNCSREPVPPVPAAINCTPSCSSPYECAGADTTVDLVGSGFSPDGEVVATWSGPCPIADPNSFTTTADCAGTGTFVFTLTVTLDENADGNPGANEQSNSCDLLLTVQDTEPPVPALPADQVEECTGPDGAFVSLSASASDVCDGATISNSRTGPSADASDTYPIGESTVCWEVCDGADNCTGGHTNVVVEDTEAPSVSLAGGTEVCLWSPNHKYVGLSLEDLGISVDDSCDDDPRLRITCTSDEAEDAEGDGTTNGDCLVVSDSTLEEPRQILVRTERSGKGDGRTYTVTITAVDDEGNESAPAVMTITVPHNAPADDCISPGPAHLIL